MLSQQEHRDRHTTHAQRKNVFILGHDAQHEQDVNDISHPERVQTHALLSSDELVNQDNYDIEGLLNKARKQLDEFSGSIDAIVCHWDFPATFLQSILCKEYGLLAPSLPALMKCAHKYWSRMEQQKVVPEHTPAFNAADPFDDNALEKMDLDFPFWIKPIKGYGSMLGFHIGNTEDFHNAMAEARKTINNLGNPFDDIMHRLELPPELAHITGNFMIAEQYITGKEFAPEGYVQHGKCHVHGQIDMVISHNGRSFERYEYPSTVPKSVQQRAVAITCKLMKHIDFDNGCFNIEFFWNQDADALWIVEINPRISQSHSYLFEEVDGLSNHEVAIGVALGKSPEFEKGKGPYTRAAKFLHRRYDRENLVCTGIPSQQDIAELQKRQPDTLVFPRIQEGMQLAEMKEQDPYSYVIADILIAANSQEELEQRYREASELLPFDFTPVSNN